MTDWHHRALGGRTPAQFTRAVLRTLAEPVLALSPQRRAARARIAAFDRKWGTDTSQTMERSALGLDREAARHAGRYQTTVTDRLPGVLAGLPVDLRHASFVDFGSGKGRVLLTAAQLPFRLVMGVELSARLCAIARDNVAIMQRHGALQAPIEILHDDARNCVLPQGQLITYFYNPFGAEIMESVVGRLETANAGARLFAIYVDPRHVQCFDAARWRTMRREGSAIIFERLGAVAA